MNFPLLVRALILSLLFVVYSALSADEAGNATEPKAGETIAEPAGDTDKKPAGEAVAFPLQENESNTLDPVPVAPIRPEQIALLLPLKSATYGRAAEAVRDGFLAAAKLAGPDMSLPIEIYDSEEGSANLLQIYNRVLADNTRIVVGPMTRGEVSQLAVSGQVTTPTLALNVPDAGGQLPKQFYSLSLSQEAEARQIAGIAYAHGQRRAAIVASASPLSKRMQSAFAAQWLQLGGKTTLEYVYSAEPKSLAQFRNALKAQQVDVVFVAADANVARKILPYIKAGTPVFATSQVLRSKSDTALNMDLKGLQFVDMPWLIKPDHAAVMVYPPAKKSLSADLQRFYALGIDAFRLTQLLLRSELPPTEPIDGVSGRITLTGGHLFARDLLQATFDQTGAVKSQAP